MLLPILAGCHLNVAQTQLGSIANMHRRGVCARSLVLTWTILSMFEAVPWTKYTAGTSVMGSRRVSIWRCSVTPPFKRRSCTPTSGAMMLLLKASRTRILYGAAESSVSRFLSIEAASLKWSIRRMASARHKSMRPCSVEGLKLAANVHMKTWDKREKQPGWRVHLFVSV